MKTPDDEYSLERAARQAGIPPERFRAIIERFLKTRIDSYLRDLDAAVTAGDLDMIRQESHKLKGAVANFRHTPLTDILTRMENLARNGDPGDYRGMFIKINDETGRFRYLFQGGSDG